MNNDNNVGFRWGKNPIKKNPGDQPSRDLGIGSHRCGWSWMVQLVANDWIHGGDIYTWLVVWNMNFIFPYIGNNHPNWLSYFSEGLKPPTRYSWDMLGWFEHQFVLAWVWRPMISTMLMSTMFTVDWRPMMWWKIWVSWSICSEFYCGVWCSQAPNPSHSSTVWGVILRWFTTLILTNPPWYTSTITIYIITI